MAHKPAVVGATGRVKVLEFVVFGVGAAQDKVISCSVGRGVAWVSV